MIFYLESTRKYQWQQAYFILATHNLHTEMDQFVLRNLVDWCAYCTLLAITNKYDKFLTCFYKDEQKVALKSLIIILNGKILL